MGKKIIITGTPGCGKTTLISKLKGVRVFNMGTEIMKHAPKGVTRDGLRTLNKNELKEMSFKVFKDLNNIKENIIIDTHTSVKSGNRYVPGFSKEELGMLKSVTAIIYLDAPAVEILLRRISDNTRKRENETAESIDEQRDVNIALASYYAQELDAALYIIENRHNMVEQAVKEVQSAIKEAFSN